MRHGKHAGFQVLMVASRSSNFRILGRVSFFQFQDSWSRLVLPISGFFVVTTGTHRVELQDVIRIRYDLVQIV